MPFAGCDGRGLCGGVSPLPVNACAICPGVSFRPDKSGFHSTPGYSRVVPAGTQKIRTFDFLPSWMTLQNQFDFVTVDRSSIDMSMNAISQFFVALVSAGFLIGASPLQAAESPVLPAPGSPATPEAMEVVKIAINAPATNYAIKIVEIRKVGGELWVLSKVEKKGDFGGGAITKVSDQVEIPKQGLPLKHFVAGKSWGWEDPKTVNYLPGEAMTDEKWAEGTPVWKSEKAEPKGAGVPTFEEWVKGGRKIPEGLAFAGGSPWFDERTGKNRTPEAVYQMLYGGGE
jgi:hypothetical protein